MKFSRTALTSLMKIVFTIWVDYLKEAYLKPRFNKSLDLQISSLIVDYFKKQFTSLRLLIGLVTKFYCGSSVVSVSLDLSYNGAKAI